MMTPPSLAHHRRTQAFTLVELVVVLAIIGLMAGLAVPGYRSAMTRARTIKCAANLSVLGTAASLAATDNNNVYPEIDQAAVPIYNPQGPNIITVLGTYGVTTNTLQCPIDMGTSPPSFQTYGSSYEWDPVFDDEPVNATVVYITPTVAIPVNSSHVRLAMDFTSLHNGRPNVVYGDGHVALH